MADITDVLSWLEWLTFDDWRDYHSDSEVQTIAKAAMELLKGMMDQIEHTHSCMLCGNYYRCSPDAPFDSEEYQIFAGCHGSLKDNWIWQGVKQSD